MTCSEYYYGADLFSLCYTHTDQPTTFLNSPKDSRLSDGTVWFSTGAALSPIHQECKRKTIIGSREGYFFLLDLISQFHVEKKRKIDIMSLPLKEHQ